MIVVFDGRCNACNAYVGFLARHDRRKRLTFVTAQSARGRAWLQACGEAPDDPSTMVVVDDDGTRRLRSDAVLAAVAALGGGWRMVRVFALFPRGVGDAFYSAFARHRYRWFGRADTCSACDGDAWGDAHDNTRRDA